MVICVLPSEITLNVYCPCFIILSYLGDLPVYSTPITLPPPPPFDSKHSRWAICNRNYSAAIPNSVKQTFAANVTHGVISIETLTVLLLLFKLPRAADKQANVVWLFPARVSSYAQSVHKSAINIVTAVLIWSRVSYVRMRMYLDSVSLLPFVGCGIRIVRYTAMFSRCYFGEVEQRKYWIFDQHEKRTNLLFICMFT